MKNGITSFLKSKNGLSTLAVLLALAIPSYVPITIAAIVMGAIFVWIVYLLIHDGMTLRKNMEHTHFCVEQVALIVLLFSCAYDIITNIGHDGEMRWNEYLLTAIIIILFVVHCTCIGCQDYIVLFVKTCNIWILFSMCEVVIRVLMFHSKDYFLFLCGYDNGLGAFLPPIICMNLFLLRNNKRDILMLLGTIAGVVQVFLVWSVTSMMSMLMLLVFFLATKFEIISRILSPFVIMMCGGAVFLFVVVLNAYNNTVTRLIITKLMHRTMDLSNRTYVWQESFKYIKGSLLLGHGADTDGQIALFGVPNAHNFYLDIASRSGLIGITLALICFILSIIVVKKSENKTGRLLLSAFFVLLIPMQFESYCNYSGYSLYYLPLVMSICMNRMILNQHSL